VAVEASPAASPIATWSVEAMDDDSFLATPASMSSSKPLRINLDLRLVSSSAAEAVLASWHACMQSTATVCIGTLKNMQMLMFYK
jgi:hypothetical protein